MSRVSRSDDSIINGEWHYCPDCKTRYSDSDGGCECTICDACNKHFNPDKDTAHIKKQKKLGNTVFTQTFYLCGECALQKAFEEAEEAGV